MKVHRNPTVDEIISHIHTLLLDASDAMRDGVCTRTETQFREAVREKITALRTAIKPVPSSITRRPRKPKPTIEPGQQGVTLERWARVFTRDITERTCVGCGAVVERGVQLVVRTRAGQDEIALCLLCAVVVQRAK